MKIKLIAVMALLFVSSCATVSLEQMKSDTQGYELPLKSKKDKVSVYVVRPSGIGPVIKFNVFLDDRENDSEMGFTQGNQYIYFYATPGKHKISSKAENWSDIEIEANGGESVFVQQIATPGFIMARNKLKIISETEGKFYIKKASKTGVMLKLEKVSNQ